MYSLGIDDGDSEKQAFEQAEVAPSVMSVEYVGRTGRGPHARYSAAGTRTNPLKELREF